MDDRVLTVPMTKIVKMEVSNGEIRVYRKDDTYTLEYHNIFFKNTPFRMPTQFSTSFSIDEILKSNEVKKFMKRFE